LRTTVLRHLRMKNNDELNSYNSCDRNSFKSVQVDEYYERSKKGEKVGKNCTREKRIFA